MAHRTPHRKSKVRPFVLGFQHPWAGVRWGDWLNSHECPMMPHDVPWCPMLSHDAPWCPMHFLTKMKKCLQPPGVYWRRYICQYLSSFLQQTWVWLWKPSSFLSCTLWAWPAMGTSARTWPQQKCFQNRQFLQVKHLQRTWSALLLKHTKAWKGSSFVIPLPPYAPRR